jgi:hypothetical protein
MRTRRDFLSGAAGLALLPYASGAAGAQGTLVNDIHSQLNATRVDRVVAVDSEAALRRAIRSARCDGKAVSIAGGRHAMGGQQFASGAVLIDTRPMQRELRLDARRGIVEAAERLKAMDAMGIDMEVLSINPFWYRKDREIAADIVRVQNEKLAELCASQPDRFAAFASLALQFPDLAVQQLEDGMKKYGLRGAAIGGSVAGEEFADPRFHPVWRWRRSSARCCSSNRRARRNWRSASRAMAGSPTPSAIRSTPRSSCST